MAAPQAARLAAFVDLPEATITSLIASPSTELLRELLLKVEEKALEHERIVAEKLRLDVELETAVRSAQSKAKVMRSSIENAQKNAAELQQQLDAERQTKVSLQSELSEIKSSSTSSATDLTNLQQRVTSLESTNRDTLSLLESKSRSYDGLAQELSAKHQKTVDLRHEVADLEDKFRAAEAETRGARLREQALQQEVDSLKRSNDYLEQELEKRTSEHRKFRSEKNLRVSELQHQLEDNAATIEGLQRSEKALRNRSSELEEKTEDYLAQIQQVKEELTRQEDSFRAELETANKLHQLMKERAETEKARKDDLQDQYEAIQDEARDEVARLEAELKTVHDEFDLAKKSIAELEADNERLQTDLSTAQTNVLATPRAGSSIRPGSAPRTPQRGMSPAPPGSAFKASVSQTQLVNDYYQVRKERDAEKRRSEQLSAQLDQMIQDLEQRQPEIENLRSDHERLQGDVAEMSSLVETVGKERDFAKKEARNMQSQVAGLTQESEYLRQQLRDLASQIRVLLLEVNARDQGRAAFTPEERLRLEQLAAGDDEAMDYSNDTDRFISENLVTFRNIVELQEQNMKMLRISRELGDKMEGEEARERQSQAAKDHEEVIELRQKYERCRDEIKSLITQSQSYIRERDIFRRMLAHRGQIPAQSDVGSMFGESVNGDSLRTPARNGVHQSVEMSPGSKEVADFNKLIKEMQSHFDNYKSETSEERKQLKDQVQGFTSKIGELRNDLARKSGELTLATERYEMLQGNYAMLKTENFELQKQSRANSDRAAQQDLRVQSVAEDLVEAKGMLEGLRKESANLKAEKEFWKSVENRLNEDNQRYMTERDRLNTLNGNLQNLLNDREHSDNESRRRLQSQIESLEAEVQSAKRKLTEAEEESKRNSMRREYDNQEAQTRIDDLVKSLGSTREEFAAAKATRDQLQLRVDELTIELRSAEERLHVLSLQPSMESNGQGDNTMTLSQDQDLALQVSELKRDLELAKREVTNAQEQVEQYKAISQSSEEQLESLNASHDQYRQEIDALIEEKEAKVKELEQTIERMQVGTDERNAELETLRAEKENHDRALQDQRSQFENEMTHLKDACERAETAARFHQEDLRAQAEIARQAQENYDNELQKHAEASRSFQIVRTEMNQLRLELVELRTAKESAEQTLSQSEEAWVESKARFEQEITEIRSRRDDVNAQNKILHEQLEKVNNQIVDLQRNRVATSAPEEVGLGSSQSNDVGGLQELIKYLRREKEIVDIQYQQQALESKRQRQQIEHLQTQLDEARLKVSQQMRAEEDRERSALNHNKLMETINELNLIRESNATLRHERSQAQHSLAERVKEVETLQIDLQSLHAKVQELEDLRETQQEDLRMAREARERFEQRYHDVLNKTDSIDPAEVESLREQIQVLETERDELKTQTESLQQEVGTFAERLEKSLAEANEAAQERQKKIIDQAKQRSRDQTAKIKEKDQALLQATEIQQQLQKQLADLRSELDRTKYASSELEERLKQAEQASVEQGASTEGIANAEIASIRNQLAQATTRADSSVAETTEIRKQLVTTQARVRELEGALSATKASLEQAQSEITRLQPDNGNKVATQDDAVNATLKQELLEAIQDVLALREGTVAPEEGEDSQVSGQMADKASEILAELVSRHEKRIADSEAEVTSRVDALKTELNTKMSNAEAAARKDLQSQHASALQQLQEEHRQEIEDLNVRHKSEVEELQRQISSVPPASEPTPAGTEPPFSPENFNQDQARELLKSNKFIRELVIKNITTKVNQAKEQVAKEWTEKLSEVESKAKTAQDQAVQVARDQAQAMEAKKQSVKLNMAQNQSRMAIVKLDYVKTTAADTPQKPVGEVWETAKDLKPPTPAVTTNNGTPVKPSGLGSSVHAQSPVTPKPVLTNAVPQSPASSQPKGGLLGSSQHAPIGQGAPNPFVQPATAQPTVPPASAAPVVSNPFASSTSTTAQAPESPFTQPTGAESTEVKAEAPKPTAAAPAAPPGPAAAAAGQAIARPPSQQQSRLPEAPQAGRGGGRGQIGSNLPVPGGRGQPAQRGQAAQRGRGRGAGRGTGIPQPGVQQQPQQPQQQVQQQQQQQQQGGGNMNPGAKQFVPQKRGLDASEHAGGGAEKRQKGPKP